MEEYKIIYISFFSLIICQIIKFIFESLRFKNLRWNRLINGAGGIPSAHASFTFSLVTSIGIIEGFNSSIFALAFIISLIVCYDAMGVRFESGKQAEVINDMAEVIEKDHKFRKVSFEHLKEQLGHKPFEVIMGMILGVLVSVFFNYIVF